MRKNNVSRCPLIVVLVVFSILLLVAVTDVSATTLGTAAMSDASSSVQFSSWRMGSGSLLSQSTLALGALSNRSLTSNVGYTLNTAAVTTQSSYTFRPNRYETAAPVNYSYSAAAQRVRQPGRRHHRGGASGGVATAVVAVPDIGNSLILFAIALGGFAALRVLPSVRTT